MNEAVLRHLSEQYEHIDADCVGRYRETFGKSDTTRWVLSDILNTLYTNHLTMSTAEEALIHNLGMLIAAKCGMMHEEHAKKGYIVDALWKMPPLPWVQDEDEKEQ